MRQVTGEMPTTPQASEHPAHTSNKFLHHEVLDKIEAHNTPAMALDAILPSFHVKWLEGSKDHIPLVGLGAAFWAFSIGSWTHICGKVELLRKGNEGRIAEKAPVTWTCAHVWSVDCTGEREEGACTYQRNVNSAADYLILVLVQRPPLTRLSNRKQKRLHQKPLLGFERGIAHWTISLRHARSSTRTDMAHDLVPSARRARQRNHGWRAPELEHGSKI